MTLTKKASSAPKSKRAPTMGAALQAISAPRAGGAAEDEAELEIEIDSGSGNVFADLQVADASAMSLKSGLAMRMADLIDQRGLTQAQVAEITGLNQSDVSRLKRGLLQEYSSDRIMRALSLLDADVEITVYAGGDKVGETFTIAAAA